MTLLDGGESRTHKLLAIDGNSLLYRAFFAMKRDLKTVEGLSTNAVYGLALMLFRLLEEEKPDSIVVAFDAPVKTFRHEEFDGYKAHRKPAPDELREQAPIARQLVQAFNIPIIEIPGFEADDVVGTIARQSCERGYETIIVTGDLDALQLVNPCVKVMTTVKGVTDTVIYDEKAVEERFGIPPSRMVDYKALKGDPSDNIPGVRGIGDKKACMLVQQFGSIESMYERIDELKDEKLKNLLLASARDAEMSKRLATIVTDVPVEVTVEDLKVREPDYERLRTLFRELEFRSLLKRIPEPAEPGDYMDIPRAELGVCRTIESEAEFRALVEHLQSVGRFALRTHTTDGKPTESDLLGLAFSTGIGETAYVRVKREGPPMDSSGTLFGFDTEVEEKPFAVDISELRGILESPDILKIGHDLKNDIETLKLKNVKLCGINFDTMLGAYVLNSTRSSYTMSDIAFEQLGLELPEIEKRPKKGDVQPEPDVTTCAEAEAAWRMVPVLQEKLERDGLLELMQNVEMPLAPVLADMELRGVAVDTDYLATLSVQLNDSIRKLEQEIYSLAGHEFNIGSPKQIQTVLFEEMQLPAGKKTKTGFSTDAETLEALSVMYPIVAAILRWRELSKLKSTYADALPKLINRKTGRIHTSLNQAVTTTGRLSSSEPNLQNIPVRTEVGRQIRKAFVATGDNLLLSADYSQIELRILAHVTDDFELVRAFEHDEDIHTHTASTLFSVPEAEVTPDMRRVAKTVNFAVIYGMSDFGLARELGITTREAHDFIQRYFAKFPGVSRYTTETVEFAQKTGHVLTLLGRRRYIPEINSSNRNVRQFAERAAVNMPIQGAAADIIKLAMVSVSKALEERKLAAQMVLQVHDELVFEVPPDEVDEVASLVRERMENAFELAVKLLVDVKVGKNWAEMEPVS